MTWIIALSVVVADRISKWICQTSLQPLGSVPVIKGIFHLTYVENRGAAFGILQNKTWFFIPATLIILVILLYMLIRVKTNSKLMRVSLALIAGGAVGNLIDRIWLGYVVDFLDFRIWPVFNIADSSVVVGALILGYLVLVKGEGISYG
jgi:signal peptidase II